ncbi:SGNH/GDSL hydrolase family protein [Rhizobium mongolense]|uniref:SGNH/GDSL hydrolase family protein n=1 Tax=Rhizobium mongolense TaxID=57676 RepID=UPI0034A13CC4
MLVKTVSTVVTTDSTGKPVDALPVRNAVEGETDAAGRPVTPIAITEDPNGIPVRVVTGKSAQNSAGQWVDTIPVSGADAVIAMLAHRVYGAGYNGGTAPPTGDGNAKTYAANFVNDSGAPIETASIAFQGWTLRTTGTTDASATFTPSGTVEYPVGTPVGTVPATAVSPGANVASAEFELSATIPVGGTFRVSLTATPANGATYIANLGFAGLRNHALRSTMKKLAVAGFGDSIMTNNGGSLYNAALGRCPVYLNSIAGTTAQTYAAAGFSKQAGIAELLGCTDVAVNFGTNDLAGGRTVVQLTGDYATMRTEVRNRNMEWVQMTILPRTTTVAAVSATLTSSGNSIIAQVADASKFRVGRPYFIAGATQTEYNNTKICTARDLGANTVTFHFQGSATTPATGTITITAWKATSEVEFMAPLWAGAGSVRGLSNTWIRDPENVDDVVEWGDACEPTRDSCRWLIAGESTLLPDVELITVSSVISTSRFNSNYSRGSSTIPNGFVTPLTGANIGVTKNGNGNTNGDITVSSAWTNAQQVGDQYYAVPGVGYMADDHLHPRAAAGGKGGQQHLDNVTAAWMDQKLAA